MEKDTKSYHLPTHHLPYLLTQARLGIGQQFVQSGRRRVCWTRLRGHKGVILSWTTGSVQLKLISMKSDRLFLGIDRLQSRPSIIC